MKTIVLKNTNGNTSNTLYLTIAKHWVSVDEEVAVLEDGYWDEFPVNNLAKVKLRNNLKYEQDAVAKIVNLGIFNSQINHKLQNYQFCEVVKGGYSYFL